MELSGGPGWPDDPDWLSSQDWHPDGYAPTPGLRLLLDIGGESSPDLFGVVSYAVVFVYTLGLVSAVLDTIDPMLFLNGREQLGIATGFHDGDIALLALAQGPLGRAGRHKSSANLQPFFRLASGWSGTLAG